MVQIVMRVNTDCMRVKIKCERDKLHLYERNKKAQKRRSNIKGHGEK